MTDYDDFLAECDDVIDDWHGSFDSASWAADGSHERDIGGSRNRVFIAPVSSTEAPDWTEVTHLMSVLAVRVRDQIGPALARAGEALRRTVEPVDKNPELSERVATQRQPRVNRRDAETCSNDARQQVTRRRGINAQHSPYGPQRRSH